MSEKEFVESNQRFVIDFLFGLIVWLFGVVVFLPVSVEYALDWQRIFALIYLVVIGYYWILAWRSSGPLFGYLSNKVTSLYMGWREIEEGKRPEVWRNIQKVLGTLVMLVVYLMLRPLMYAVSVVLPGIAFILILIQLIIYVNHPLAKLVK
jgi:hypothetical protein